MNKTETELILKDIEMQIMPVLTMLKNIAPQSRISFLKILERSGLFE